MRRAASVALLAAAATLGGCGLFGGGKSTAEPPAELVEFERVIEIDDVWSRRVGKGSEQLRLGLRPASDGMRVYAAARDGTVAALDAETGRVQWSIDTDLPLSAGPAFGVGLLAVAASNGELVLIDSETGEERWRRPSAVTSWRCAASTAGCAGSRRRAVPSCGAFSRTCRL